MSLSRKADSGIVNTVEEMKKFCADKVLSIKNEACGGKTGWGFLDGLSSGLALFAFNSSKPKHNGL